MEKNVQKVGVISLGLIGGSILKALCKKYDLYCYSTSLAKEAFNYSENISDNLEIIKDCDIVFVCSPISKTLEMLEKLENIVRKDCIVLDCASVKKDFLNKKFNYNFIMSHPMAGREKTGFEASEEFLFKGAKWLVEKDNPLAKKIIEDTGANMVITDMNKHDYMCAMISHLPMFLAYGLFSCADDNSKYIASSGFRDMTRLVSNPLMSADMLELNKDNIDNALNNMIEKLNYLKNLSYNEKIKIFKELSKERSKMYNEQGQNVFKP
ncbi:MAG: prephenate dehydrogenase/arogenate dehydrogenase family protein [Candidatus Gastranaerophilales bacterium]|nr:prephenate dehydrogenase/arogenate dehydrogenase family protein [Candidatus Gastranaerophilales bacterium]